jgi:hypothetical protein
MDDFRPDTPTHDRPCPLAFVVLAAFVSALAWLSVVVVNLPLR